MKTSCKHTDCINCSNGHCVALTEVIQHNCSFYKTKAVYELENSKNKMAIKRHFFQKLQEGKTITSQNAAFLFDISIKNFYRYMKICNIKSRHISIYHMEILAEEISKRRRNKTSEEAKVVGCALIECIFNGNNMCQIFNEDGEKNCSFYKALLQYPLQDKTTESKKPLNAEKIKIQRQRN